MRPGQRALLSLGSNLGRREGWLSVAWEVLREAGVEVLGSTPRWNTRPLGGPPQPDYLNQVLLLEGSLDPLDWLAAARRAEDRAGRTRTVEKGPRRLDVDVILVGTQRLVSGALTLPHPALLERPYLLLGCAYLVPDWCLPGTDQLFSDVARARLAGCWARPVPLRAAAGRPGPGSS